MSTAPQPPSPELAQIVKQLPDAHQGTIESFNVKSGEGYAEKLVDAIEMIGEEAAAKMPIPSADSTVTPGMRYLHCSRTIHDLVTDRNRAVGLFLAIASLLITACSALVNANPQAELIIPLALIQKWCFPFTFGVLTVLAFLAAFLLIRTRVGLIYEAAKMNVLLGLPIGRSQRLAPLSISFLMQTIISMAGGTCAGIFSLHMIYWDDPETEYGIWWATLVGFVISLALMLLYIGIVMHTTSDKRLQQIGK